MSQSPGQQPQEQPTPEQVEFDHLLQQPPYSDYLDELQRTVDKEAQGDPQQVVRIKQDLLRRLIGHFPPLKDAYDRAYPETKPEEQ